MLNTIKKTTLATIASVALVGGLGATAQAATTQPTTVTTAPSPQTFSSGQSVATSGSQAITLEAQNRRGFKSRKAYKRSNRHFNNRDIRDRNNRDIRDRRFNKRRFDNRIYYRGDYNRGFDQGYYYNRGYGHSSISITLGGNYGHYGRGSYGYRY